MVLTMKKTVITTFLIVMILFVGISGCSNNDPEVNDELNINEESVISEESVENNEVIDNEAVEVTDDDATSTKELEEIFPLYVQYLGTIADSINETLLELETKDQYYFEQNPNDGINLLYNIITDYKGYIAVLEGLEYNSNPDIKKLNFLFIDGLTENIKVFELSIDSLENETYSEEEYTNQLVVVQDKFKKFSELYVVIAEKAGYEFE